MADLMKIVSFADDYLGADSFKDCTPNGLQVSGVCEVSKIVTGVSACMELFEAAKEESAQAVLAHHGMFFDSDPRIVTGSVKERLKFLLHNDISLIAYHLPLDAHTDIGNNASIVSTLGLVDKEPFGTYGNKTIGFLAKTAEPLPVSELVKAVQTKINLMTRHYCFGPHEVNRIAILSGGAPGLLREAISAGADVFLTGEDTEWIYHLAKEEGIHYLACGHHATERFGAKALGEVISGKFGIEAKFVDIPNPI